MTEIEKRFGWRLEKVIDLIKKENYDEAFKEYSNLIKLFNCLHGYEDTEKIDFYSKIKDVGDDFLFKLAKKKILGKVEGHRFSNDEFKKRLRRITKKDLDEKICNLIKKEKFEKALRKHYENR